MFLWRNLPEGQLTAVLSWLHNGRQTPSGKTPAGPAVIGDSGKTDPAKVPPLPS